MKILWLSHLIPYPPKSGVLLRSYNLIRELSKHHRVDLISFIQRSYMESLFPSYGEGLQRSMEALSSFCGNVQFIPIPFDFHRLGKPVQAMRSLFTRDPYTINWLKCRNFGESIQNGINRTRYDLVHFDTISLCPYKKFIPTVPAILDHHNIESNMMLRRAANESNMFLKAYYLQEGRRLEQYEKKTCHKFDLNITCSELDSRRLLHVNQHVNVKEVPNGVDLEYFKPSTGETIPNTLIFVGSMNWYPNIAAMIFFLTDIWPLLKRKVPDCVLHIVGAGPSESIKKYSVHDKNVHVHGFVDDVRPYIEKSAVYVCPIRDGGGTKLKLLDAFAMKKAVVAHPVACEGIRVQPGRDVLFAEQPNDFVRKICRLLEDPHLRRVVGDNARQMVGLNYSYKTIGERMSLMYQKLYSGAKSRVY